MAKSATPINKPPALVEIIVEHDGKQDRGMWLPILGIWVIEGETLSDERVSHWHTIT